MKVNVLGRWQARLITPRSQAVDDRRRELILNIILCVLTLVSLVSAATTIINHLQDKQIGRTDTLGAMIVFTAVLMLLWWLSRKGLYVFSSYALLAFGLFGATQLLLAYSYQLPATEMAFAILVVMASVLLRARTALWLTGGLIVYLLIVSDIQISGQLHPDTQWLNQPLEISDSIGFLASLLIIGVISWLANREIDRSLDRARRSEAALEAERDQLEIKVVERTRELEQAQLVRVMELQRLAEFGRLSAGLLHEVANPLTVASINLEQLSGQSRSLLLKRATESLQYIERFLEAARKQLKSQGSLTEFGVQSEIKQVLAILDHRARESEVKLVLQPAPRYRLYGDPVKFNQIMANLLINAIEAYDDSDLIDRRVTISLRRRDKWLEIAVHDQGRGLHESQLDRIFEPFYTTKPADHPNMGIGLATVKQLVENDFKGSVSVNSQADTGTSFKVRLQNQKRS